MPQVLDARPCANGIALTMYNEIDGSCLPPLIVADSNVHSVIVHLPVDYTSVLSSKHCHMLMAGIWCNLHYDRVEDKEQWEALMNRPPTRASSILALGEIRGSNLSPKIFKCVLRSSGYTDKPKVYGALCGKDHLHAWLEIDFKGPKSPSTDPVGELHWLQELVNSKAAKVFDWDRHLYYVNSGLVEIAGMGIVSRCRKLMIENPCTVKARPECVCFDAEWEDNKPPHLFAFVWVRKSDKVEVVLSTLDDELAETMRDREVDSESCLPDMFKKCRPTKTFVRKDGVIICMYPKAMVTVAAVEVICKLAPVVIGFGNRGGDFLTLNRYVPGVFTQRTKGATEWWMVDYSIDSGNWPVYIDYKDAFTRKRNPVGPDVGAFSGMPLDLAPDRTRAYAQDLRCLLSHMLGKTVSDKKRKWEASMLHTPKEMDYCLGDARAVWELTRDDRLSTVHGLCNMAGVPWNWMSVPAALKPPGFEAVAIASMVASIARCGILPCRFQAEKAFNLPGGINYGIPPNIYSHVAKFDLQRAYSTTIADIDATVLLIGFNCKQLEGMECKLHLVPNRGNPNFSNLNVISSTQQTPMQYLMGNPNNPKLMVNAIVGCFQSGCMGKNMQLVAFAAMAVVHDACNRMREVAINKLSCCQVCDTVHTPGTECDRYEAPEIPMCVPAITDEVVLFHLTPGTEEYAHQVLQSELRLSFLAKALVLKPAEIGTLISWSGSSAFLMPPNATPSECKGKGSLLNALSEHVNVKRVKMALFYLTATLVFQSRLSANFKLGLAELESAISESVDHVQDPITDIWPGVLSAFRKIGIDSDIIHIVNEHFTLMVSTLYGLDETVKE